MISETLCHSVGGGGGGVVAEMIRDLKKTMRFSSVGGGRYYRELSVVSKSLRDSVGGGGSTVFLCSDLKTSFFVNGALLHFFTFPKGGGGPGPLGPPLNRPLHCVSGKCSTQF